MPEDIRSSAEEDSARSDTREALLETIGWPRPCPLLIVGDATVEVFSSPSQQRIIYVHRSPGQVCIVDNEYQVLHMGKGLPTFVHVYAPYEVAEQSALEVLRTCTGFVAQAVDIERKRKAGLLGPPPAPELPAPVSADDATPSEQVGSPVAPQQKRAAAPLVSHTPTQAELEWDRRFDELFAAARANEIAESRRDNYLKPRIRREVEALLGARPYRSEHAVEHAAAPREKRPPRKKPDAAPKPKQKNERTAAATAVVNPVPIAVPQPPAVVEAPAEPAQDPSRPLFGSALYASLFPEASKNIPKDARACVARFSLAVLITVRELHAAAITAQKTVNIANQEVRRDPKKQLALPDGRTFSELQMESLLSVANDRVGTLTTLIAEIEKLDREE